MNNQKTIDKCLLADDVKDKSPVVFYNINRKRKRSSKICPRCNQRTVNKILRKCVNPNCNGRLHWQGDDCRLSDAELEWWFMWMTDLYGVTGWFNKDYFHGKFNVMNRL